MKTLGLETTTLFEFFEIAFCPTNRMSGKILLYTHVQQQKILLGVVLHKLLYTETHAHPHTRCNRNRGIRDEATAYEPEVVS